MAGAWWGECGAPDHGGGPGPRLCYGPAFLPARYRHQMNIDWGDAPAWAALVIALAAFIVSVVSARYSGRSAGAAERSATASESSANTATEALQEARRSSDAAERSAVAGETQANLAVEEATAYQMPWRPMTVGKHRRRLVNGGNETCHSVQVSGESVDEVGPHDVEPGDMVEFMYSPTHGDSSLVRVTWRRPDDRGGEIKEKTFSSL